jgi:septal ring factor EnvC (AmiA/AmiB activator)
MSLTVRKCAGFMGVRLRIPAVAIWIIGRGLAMDFEWMKRERIERIERKIEELMDERIYLEDQLVDEADTLTDEQYGALEDEVDEISKEISDLEAEIEIIKSTSARQIVLEWIADERERR